eukprot:SAG31_NODE_23429_length_504_cov_1.348148_1_plen_158_part_01
MQVLYELSVKLEYADAVGQGSYMIGVYNGKNSKRLVWQNEHEKRYSSSIFQKELMEKLWSLQTGPEGEISDKSMSRGELAFDDGCCSKGMKQSEQNGSTRTKTVNMYFTAGQLKSEEQRAIPLQIRIAAAGVAVRYHSVNLSTFKTMAHHNKSVHDNM